MTSTRKVPVPVGRVENLNERLGGRGAFRDLQFLVALRHLTPGSGVGEAVGETELAPQELVHRAHDVGDHWAWRVEDAPAHLLLLVVGSEEVLVEVDDRVFLGVPVAEVADDGLHVGLVEELHDIGDAQLVEVDARAAGPATPPAHA